jgi:hypothetical protein
MHIPHINPDLVLTLTAISAVSNVIINSVMLYYYWGTFKALLAKAKL